jgi:hypothetical protein
MSNAPNHDLAAFFGLVVLAAAWAVLHLDLAMITVRARALAWQWRWLGWLPPFTPVAAYLAGARARALLWVVLGAGYLVLRTAS